MKRGVIQLDQSTKPKLQQINNANFPKTLQDKINSLSEETFYLEISSQEAEAILDTLPAPDQADPVDNQLRYQIGQLLQ